MAILRSTSGSSWHIGVSSAAAPVSSSSSSSSINGIATQRSFENGGGAPASHFPDPPRKPLLSSGLNGGGLNGVGFTGFVHHQGSFKLKSGRISRRPGGRPAGGSSRNSRIGILIIALLCTIALTTLGAEYIFFLGSSPKGKRGHYGPHRKHGDSFFVSLWSLVTGDGLEYGSINLPCDIDFRNTTRGMKEPGSNPKFFNFTLKYMQEEKRPDGATDWEPLFAGHQSLAEREESFRAGNQTIPCGFVKGPEGSPSTGFDLAESDVKFMSTCRIVVNSCIFGNSDRIHIPRGKKLTGNFKKDVCFVMFVDRDSLKVMVGEGQVPDDQGFLGLWKIVTVQNLPYSDSRRNGKIPKFLAHRLFPSARYSIWIDSKLRLQSDSVLILEYLLWRKGNEYAISNHYDRHCVWDEVKQNKRLNKYDHRVIDKQFEFYQADGLTKFNASDPKKLLPSYVPEGSFIVRAHTPMSNLFSCLWFNEVNRFTPRDQLSFAYTYIKLVRTNADRPFYLKMFKDCERRTMAKLFHHRRNATAILHQQGSINTAH